MSASIHKFERDMLHGDSIHVNVNTERNWSGKHWHSYFEIIFHDHCSGYCILNSGRYEITERCLFLLTPKDFHEIFAEGGEGSYSVIIAFDERIIDRSIISSLTAGPFMIPKADGRLCERIAELNEVFHSESQYREQYIKHIFNCILLQILSAADEIPSVSRDINPIVRESISLMLSDPAADYSLENLAERFGVTGAYFSRLFHRNAGISFKQYLTTLRVELAKQLLEENTMPIIDVSYECGFNTPSQFFRAFKGAYGIAPSEYRKAALDKKAR